MSFLRQKAFSMRMAKASQRAIFLLLTIAALAQATRTRTVGTIKAINGNSIVLTTDSGSEATIVLAASTRLLQATPGQNDLKSATPIQAADIKVGDRVLAVGAAGEANSTLASTVVVMKQSDIANKRGQEREEWRRGVGGIVKEINTAAGNVTIVNSLSSSGKPIVVHIAPATTIRRYSPDSLKFDDAKPSTLDEIKPGDQLRARGERSADGSEFTAQAIVSGTFREIAGTVISTDAANGTLTVMDLVAKRSITLRITSDSQMRKLPQLVAQRLAVRVKGGAADANATDNSGSRPSPARSTGDRARGPGEGAEGNLRAQGGPGGSTGTGGNWRGGGGASPDFQQMMGSMPGISIADLQKGDAVMLVATEGSAASPPTTITLLTGVEPILIAAPGATAAATILSPWNLGASPGGGEAAVE